MKSIQNERLIEWGLDLFVFNIHNLTSNLNEEFNWLFDWLIDWLIVLTFRGQLLTKLTGLIGSGVISRPQLGNRARIV